MKTWMLGGYVFELRAIWKEKCQVTAVLQGFLHETLMLKHDVAQHVFLCNSIYVPVQLLFCITYGQ
jgi:hypothetical protein